MTSTCLVCNGTDFEIEAGSCICTECGAHQLNFAELVEDENELFDPNKMWRAKKTVLHKTKKEIPEATPWSTFEGFNIILKTWTDILVQMGASEKFREAVFKLWVRYLQKREVAFLSPTNSSEQQTEEMSVLGMRDVVALNRGTLQKKKLKKDMLKATDKEFVDKLKRKVERKLAFHKGNATKFIAGEMSRTLDETKFFEDENMNDDDEANDKFDTSHYNSQPLMTEEDESAFDFLQEDEDESEGEDNEKGRLVTVEEQRRRSIIFGNFKISQYDLYISPYNLTIDRAVAFIYMGILIAQEDVLMFELLRLFKEDYLPYQSVIYLLPGDKDVFSSDTHHFIRGLPPAMLLRRSVAHFAAFLNIQILPLPSRESIVKKMIDRLQLPDSIYMLTIHLLHLYERKNQNALSVPSIEVSVGAAIMLLFKIQYGLDDVHEELLSDFAEGVNDVLESNNKSYRLFSWRRWFKYMNRLMYWEREVCQLQVLDKNIETHNDATRFSRFFWSQGVWKLPFLKTRGRSEAKWDTVLLQYALGLNLSSKEQVLNQKPLFKLGDRRARLALYVNELHKVDKAKDRHCALQTATELLSIDFKNDKFNWLSCKLEVELELREMGREVEIIPVKLSCPETFPKSTCETDGQSGVSKLVVPDPHQSYWKIDQSLKISNLSDSFRFLLKLISQECQTVQVDVLHEFVRYCKVFESNCRRKSFY